MEHHHPAGWAPAEIYAFAKANVGRGDPLVEIAAPHPEGGQVSARFGEVDGVDVRSAELNYTTDGGPWIDRHWHTTPATVDAPVKRVFAPLPAGVTAYYFNLIDSRGLISSSAHSELP